MNLSPEAETGHPAENILRLLYCSRVPRFKSANDIEDDIETILRASRAGNPHFGITGVLVTNKIMFSQVIEGPARLIKDLIGHISCDARHEHMKIIGFHKTDKRIFAEWSMAFLATNRDLEAENYIFPSSDDESNILAISSFCSAVRTCLIDKRMY